MVILCLVLLLIIIVITLSIMYISAYNKINVYKIKMDTANNIITESLQKKLKLMNSLSTLIKKVIKKKDYLKEFNSLQNKELSNYELDIELNTHLTTMIAFKEDYKELKTEEFNQIIEEIKELDQTIAANKKFFNKNNNWLIKNLKGYIKVVAKLNNISIKNSFEIKEPKK